MKIKNIDILHEILTEQMNHWMLIPVALTVVGASYKNVTKVGAYFWLWALCGLFPFLFFLIRSKVGSFFSLLLLHLVAAVPLPAMFRLWGSNMAFYICTFCAVGHMIYSFAIFLGTDSSYMKPFHPVAGILLSVFSMTMLRYLNITGWDIYFVAPLVGSLALYSLTVYIRQYLEFLSVNGNSAGHMPAAEMFRSGFKLVSLFVLIGAVFLLICANIGNYTSLWTTIKGSVIQFLRYLFSLLPQGEPELQEPLTEVDPSMFDLPVQTGELPKPGLISQILEIAAYVICGVFLAVCMIIALIRLLLFLRMQILKSMQHRRAREQELEPNLDVREKCGIERIPIKRKQLKEILSPAQRIRKLYKKRVLASVSELTDGNQQKLRILTPKECGKRLDEEEMAHIYEQVRYSNNEATADTLRRMKNALRHKVNNST